MQTGDDALAASFARARAQPRRVVFPEATDERIVMAAHKLHAGGIAIPILLGAADARDALIDALHDGAPTVRAATARALGQLGGDRAAAALLTVAGDADSGPASAAARALARIDPQRVIQAAQEPGASPHLLEAADLAAM